jgi:hypothetical protein
MQVRLPTKMVLNIYYVDYQYIKRNYFYQFIPRINVYCL